MRVLVTGASGFIGRALCAELLRRDITVRAALRRSAGAMEPVAGLEPVVIGTIDGTTDWRPALAGCDVVVHLAARVHVMQDGASDPLAAFRQVNTLGTLSLARQAAQAGVRRFVFLSSIKVNGEETYPADSVRLPDNGQSCFFADGTPAPGDAYAISKWEAEQGLMAIAHETRMEAVIIRPPLVYGPGVKGNFASMMRWVARGAPLPLGAVRHNRRSLVGLENLVDLIAVCLEHPAAANEVFLVGDGEDLSTAELLQRVAKAMNMQARLISVPVWLLKSVAALLGKRDVAQRLLGSLQVDISRTKELLGWMPPVSLDEGLKRMVRKQNFDGAGPG